MKRWLMVVLLLMPPLCVRAEGPFDVANPAEVIGVADPDEMIGVAGLAGAPPAGVTVTNLTSGSCSAETCTDVACNSISPSGMVIVSAAFAYAGLFTYAQASLTVSGCGLSWAEIDNEGYGSRRYLSVWKGTGTWNSAGDLTIAADDGESQTFQVTLYSIDDVTGYDSDTPNDAGVSTNDGTATTPWACSDVGTPDSGDAVYSAFGYENQESLGMTTGITTLGSANEANGVRSFIAGWDDDTADETPGITFTSGAASAGCVGFIINAE